MRRFWEDWGAIFYFLVVCVILFGACIGGIYVINGNQCNTYIRLDPEHTYAFDFWAGCLIKAENGQYLPIENYKAIVK